MLVLLPPSETKARATRGSATRLAELSFPELTATRAQVRAALVASSLAPDALNLLGVPPSLGAEVTANALVASAPSRPAREVYTGVLYDALAFAQLDAAARRRANARLLIVSALYGAVRPGDRIAAYRLSMAVNLPEVGPLARLWRPELARALPAAAGCGLIVDCRSSSSDAGLSSTPAPARMPRPGFRRATSPAAGLRCGCRGRPIWRSTPGGWWPGRSVSRRPILAGLRRSRNCSVTGSRLPCTRPRGPADRGCSTPSNASRRPLSPALVSPRWRAPRRGRR